jgi:Cysteine-rich CPCC
VTDRAEFEAMPTTSNGGVAECCGSARGRAVHLPCCGHRTLPERGMHDWCQECGWEDDGQDNHDVEAAVRRGPNGGLSLLDARAVYVARGGSPEPHLRPRIDLG